MKKELRYQECNRLQKLWRLRFILIVPLKFLFYNFFSEFKVYRDEMIDGEIVHTDNYDIIRGKNLYRLLIGDAHIKMNWTLTMEEVQEKIKNNFGRTK